MTIKDVARKAGVSIATVSRVLNDPAQVSPEKRYLVEEAIKTLHFKPNASARRLAGGRANTIGLIIPEYEGIFSSFYALEIIKYVGREVERLKKDLFVHIFRGRDVFDESKVDAVLFSDLIANDEQLKRIISRGVFCVVINNNAFGMPVSFVSIDNYKAAFDIVEYLLGLGHVRIAHITGDLKTQCAKDRLLGFQEALHRNNILFPEAYIQKGDFSRTSARRCFENLFKLQEPPTAIFCASDDMAEEVLQVCSERSVKVPEQVSLVGFDENPNYLYSPVSLTTVNQPLEAMIKEAIGFIEKFLETRKSTVLQKVLPAALVIRESTAPPEKK